MRRGVVGLVIACSLFVACETDEPTLPPAESAKTPLESPSPSPSPSPEPSYSIVGIDAIPDPQGECSAARDGFIPATLATHDLPPEVIETRDAIISAAWACDFEALAELGAGGEGFSFSFGGSTDAAEYWREAEANDEQVTAKMVRIFELPFGTRCFGGGCATDDLYVWPAVAASDQPPTDADWAEIEASGLHTPQEMAQLRTIDAYFGYRLAIRTDGDWVFFIAGD